MVQQMLPRCRPTPPPHPPSDPPGPQHSRGRRERGRGGPALRSPVIPVRGFALLELIVVLLLMGLVTALAMPNLQRLAASAAKSTERERILTQLAGLGRRALLEGRDYVVFGTGVTRDGLPPAVRETVEPGSAGADGGLAGRSFAPAAYPGHAPYTLDLPEGWEARLDAPLIIRANGVCLGAGVTLLHRGSVDVQVRLRPPYCRVDADAGS